jgi:hypothetical protein
MSYVPWEYFWPIKTMHDCAGPLIGGSIYLSIPIISSFQANGRLGFFAFSFYHACMISLDNDNVSYRYV